jgi:hypothetical protein
MSLLDATGNPVSPQVTPEQMMQLMTGLRIRIDAANAQLVQLGLLVEYLYENLEQQGTTIPMDEFPKWAEARYKEIQEQAKKAMSEGNEFADQVKQQVRDEVANAGINLNDDSDPSEDTTEKVEAPETVANKEE